jgi:hypothetical protein
MYTYSLFVDRKDLLIEDLVLIWKRKCELDVLKIHRK